MILRTLAVIALCFLPAFSTALAAQLPQGIVSRQTMGADDQRAVREFAAAHLPGLGSDDERVRQRARDAILAPLNAENVSVAFRLELSSALAPGLRQLASSSTDEHTVFNACRIAASLATDAGVGILRTALTDQRPSVRYAGAYGLRRVMRASAMGRAPLGGDQEDAILTALTAAMRTEADRGVFDGLVSAFEAIGADDRARTRAMAAMCDAASERARTLRPGPDMADAEGWARSYLRAIRGAQSTLIEQIRRTGVDQTFAKSSARLAGHALALAVQRSEAVPALRATERDALGELVRAAEVTLLFADNAVRNQNQQDQPLAQAWPDPVRTRAEALKWIGPQGVLTRAPYAFEASSFLPQR